MRHATCRGIAKAAEAIYTNASNAAAAGTAGGAMPRGQLWKVTSLEALVDVDVGLRWIVEPQTVVMCCGFPVLSHCSDSICIICPAVRLPSAFPTVIILIYRQISFSLMPIILRPLLTCRHTPAMPRVFQRADAWYHVVVVFCGVYCEP